MCCMKEAQAVEVVDGLLIKTTEQGTTDTREALLFSIDIADIKKFSGTSHEAGMNS